MLKETMRWRYAGQQALAESMTERAKFNDVSLAHTRLTSIPAIKGCA